MPLLLLQTDAQRRTSETGNSEGIIHVISTRMDFINEESLLSQALIKPLIISIMKLQLYGSLAGPDCLTWWRTLVGGDDMRWHAMICFDYKESWDWNSGQGGEVKVGLVEVHPDHQTIVFRNCHCEPCVWMWCLPINDIFSKLLCVKVLVQYLICRLGDSKATSISIWCFMEDLCRHFVTATSQGFKKTPVTPHPDIQRNQSNDWGAS